ncbi:MAG: hypothetical protein M9949_04860 [Candidatus Kapabacteria bacterium]|nr:hypothetical protein [Candidatus Kapabacteria bacterium]
MNISNIKPNGKTTATYKLSPKILEGIEKLRLSEYPSVSFSAMTEMLASEQLKRLGERDLDAIKRSPRGLSFTRDFREDLESLVKEQRGKDSLTISSLLNRLLELNLAGRNEQ